MRAESVGGGGGAAEKCLAGDGGHDTVLRREEWDGEFFTSHVEYLSSHTVSVTNSFTSSSCVLGVPNIFLFDIRELFERILF